MKLKRQWMGLEGDDDKEGSEGLKIGWYRLLRLKGFGGIGG